ncbi:RNA polymerase sigma factor [Alkalicoccus urumqiensis]|uniref:RNA polymerase subunit sigma-70 n=1 Tax=Alkalicoccus urumqiensis TaxID=1548213 RepID=A0A2P6MJ41_ALKUR|nr:sigma-70 family RNA polymerase sigma factor [Alkalicoccus urumqiensis]PRO66270.1 RNA polymerase subunit sigma-70 [Alkalicoccus urumqiensis]
MAGQEDLHLYERIVRQDADALEALYDKYEKLLYSFAWKLTGDAGTAEEVVQEVMMKLWKGTAGYQADKGKFSSWLLTMTRNAAIDLLRKKKRRDEQTVHQETEPSSDSPAVEDLVEWKEKREEIKGAMMKLKEEQRMVIQLIYFEGLSQQRTAEQIGIPLGTVKGRVRLALKHLREELASERGEWQ